MSREPRPDQCPELHHCRQPHLRRGHVWQGAVQGQCLPELPSKSHIPVSILQLSLQWIVNEMYLFFSTLRVTLAGRCWPRTGSCWAGQPWASSPTSPEWSAALTTTSCSPRSGQSQAKNIKSNHGVVSITTAPIFTNIEYFFGCLFFTSL